MGIRCAFGVRVGGKDKIVYNSMDSYPNGLGDSILDFLRDVCTLEGSWRSLIPAAQALTEDVEVTLAVDRVWLRRRVGDGAMNKLLEEGTYKDSSNFLSDSLFCEHAYIIDLDSGEFEYYVGFQEEPHTKGRYADKVARVGHRTSNYYPVALAKTFRLDAIPKGSMQEIIDESPIEELAREGGMHGRL